MSLAKMEEVQKWIRNDRYSLTRRTSVGVGAGAGTDTKKDDTVARNECFGHLISAGTTNIGAATTAAASAATEVDHQGITGITTGVSIVDSSKGATTVIGARDSGGFTGMVREVAERTMTKYRYGR
jgi:hypothetical protein